MEWYAFSHSQPVMRTHAGYRLFPFVSARRSSQARNFIGGIRRASFGGAFVVAPLVVRPAGAFCPTETVFPTTNAASFLLLVLLKFLLRLLIRLLLQLKFMFLSIVRSVVAVSNCYCYYFC